MLASTQAVATVSHGGACFEILNPRKSLDLARIVSYIEDVDSCSILSDQDSAFPLDQGLDRVSISQYTDASLTSFYSNHSLYNSLDSTPKDQDPPLSSAGAHGRIRSLSDYSLNEGYNYWNRPVQNNSEHDRYDDLPTPMTSIREESNPPTLSHSNTHSRRPSTPSTQDFYSESEIGEPGSPVYANGEWAQVDERDRGIFYELEEFDQPPYQDHDRESEPSPHETLDTPLHSPSSPALPFDLKYDPYDPIYFDPHVQSVLAAANAENMGLRGHRQFDGSREIHRRKSDERKAGGRKGLKKFFSWRSGTN